MTLNFYFVVLKLFPQPSPAPSGLYICYDVSIPSLLVQHSLQDHRLSQEPWVQILVLTLSICVLLGKLLNFCTRWYIKGINSTYVIGLLWGINELTNTKVVITSSAITIHPFKMYVLHGISWCHIPGTVLSRGEPVVVVRRAPETKGPHPSPQVLLTLTSQVVLAKSHNLLGPQFSL